MTHLEWKLTFIELLVKYKNLESIEATQWELGQASVIYAILNQVLFFLVSHRYYSFQSISNVFIEPIQCNHGHLESSRIPMGFKTHISHPSPKRPTTFQLYPPRPLSFHSHLPHLLFYLHLLYINLMTFNY